MTRDDIIKLAREAGMPPVEIVTDKPVVYPVPEALERFATLVRDYLLSTEIHTCHADCQRFACVQTRRAVEAEREACADVCEGHYDTAQAARAIRARGNA